MAAALLAATLSAIVTTGGNAHAAPSGFAFLSHFNNVVPGPSTVPGNGDVNPYGVAVVGFGLAVVPGGRGIWFVDDGTNTLDVFF